MRGGGGGAEGGRVERDRKIKHSCSRRKDREQAWQLTVSMQNLFRATHVNPIKPACRINQTS